MLSYQNLGAECGLNGLFALFRIQEFLFSCFLAYRKIRARALQNVYWRSGCADFNSKN